MTNTADSVFDTTDLSADEAAIVEIEKQMSRAQEVNEIAATWDEDVVYYDFGPGRFRTKAEAVEEIGNQFKAVTNLRTRVLELTVRVIGDMGYAFSRQNFISDIVGAEGTLNFVFRETDIFVKKDDAWRLVHQHLSAPADLNAGTVLFISEVPTPA